MQLEDYFEFEKFQTTHGPVERIRIKGHRINLEHIVSLFKQGLSAERIHGSFRTLSLEQVYAAITYYLHNQDAVEKYLEAGEGVAEAFHEEWLQKEPPPVVKRLRGVKAQQQTGQTTP